MLTLSGIGRLGREPKMQYSAGGSAVTNITVAVDSGFGDNKSTTWVNLVAFGKQAEILNQYLSKGARLSFCAELQKVYTYEKTSGGTGVSVDAKILTFAFLDGAKKEDAEPEGF